MPITITPLPGVTGLGPKLGHSFSSDFFGPLPSGSLWSWSIRTADEGLVLSGSDTAQTVDLPQWAPFSGFAGQTNVKSIVAPPAGTQVTLTVQLVQGSNGAILDTGTRTAPWDGTTNLSQLVVEQGQGGSGGLTTDQALQLQQSQQATWPQTLIDNLAVAFVGHGSSEFPANANLTSPIFGVIVRLTHIPDDLLPQTPDDDYWVKSLAVVRIFRGSDLWLRVPIHTSSKIVNLWIEGLSLGLIDAVTAAGWLLNLTLQTTFLPGVEGDVFIMRLP